MNILAINLGSTSTKIGVFIDTVCRWQHTLRHSRDELMQCPDILGQRDLRREALETLLLEQNISLDAFDMYAVRCGLIRPVQGGVYHISDAVVNDALNGRCGQHAANLGLLIGHEWSRRFGVPAVFVDAPVTDEMTPLARYSGFAGFPRRSVFHALNAKRAVRLYCREQGLNPHEEQMIVVHMGGGISVSAWREMRAVDTTNGVDGEGPFSPERVGDVSHVSVLALLDKLGGDPEAVRQALYRQGGLQSYCGTNDVRALCERAGEEPEVAMALDAMLYTIAKSVGAMAAVLEGRVRAILLTGGLAFNDGLMTKLSGKLSWLAPCRIYPGEDELAALAEGAYRVLIGEEEAKTLV